MKSLMFDFVKLQYLKNKNKTWVESCVPKWITKEECEIILGDTNV